MKNLFPLLFAIGMMAVVASCSTIKITENKNVQLKLPDSLTVALKDIILSPKEKKIIKLLGDTIQCCRPTCILIAYHPPYDNVDYVGNNEHNGDAQMQEIQELFTKYLPSIKVYPARIIFKSRKPEDMARDNPYFTVFLSYQPLLH